MSPLMIGLCFGLYLTVGYYGVIRWIEKSLRDSETAEAEEYPVLFPVFIGVLTVIWVPLILFITASSLKEYVQKKSEQRDDK